MYNWDKIENWTKVDEMDKKWKFCRIEKFLIKIEKLDKKIEKNWKLRRIEKLDKNGKVGQNWIWDKVKNWTKMNKMDKIVRSDN